MNQKIFNITIPLFLVMVAVFIGFTGNPGYSQSVEGVVPPSPKEGKYGQPLIENKPDESGKFERKIPAPRETQRLMNPNEQYPPPGLKKALNRIFLTLFIITLIVFYFLFIHGNLKKLVPALATISGRFKGAVNSSMAVSSDDISVTEEKLSNEALIRDMVIRMEKEEEVRGQLFRPFSLGRAIPPSPGLENLGIDSGESGLHLILTDSPGASRVIVYNLVKQNVRMDQPMIFLSSRISTEDIARGIIALETEKPWEKMDEQERYRISRQVEVFMEKYQGIYTLQSFKITGDNIKETINDIKLNGKITALIIDDFSLLASGDWNEILEVLKLDSRKEGIPVFIIDKMGNKTRWDAYKDIGFKSLLGISQDQNQLQINDLLSGNKFIRSLTINPDNGKLDLISS